MIWTVYNELEKERRGVFSLLIHAVDHYHDVKYGMILKMLVSTHHGGYSEMQSVKIDDCH